ncbi:ADP-ribosylation factor-like protein 3, partial [Tetrabaena socialis]
TPQKVPLLLLCNKADLAVAAAPAEVAQALHLPAAASRAFQLQACSALKGQGIKEGIQWLLDQV